MKIKALAVLICLIPYGSNAAISDCNTRKNIPSGKLTLAEVVDLGLCRNPQTAAAYFSVQSARFTKNAGYANYLPRIDASASTGVPYQDKKWGDWSYGATLSASYLIFDFGKRLADLNQLVSLWRAAGFEYDQTVQDFIYGVIGAYYNLLNADADVKSAESLRNVAQTAKDMAQKKFNAGVVARADVLKAETSLASRDLDLERAKNNREIAKATLLTKLSFPADQNITIADMPSAFGNAAENKSVDELIALARRQRPDLLRATANKDAAWHRRNAMFLRNLPSISASGSVSWNDDRFQGVYNPTSDRVNGTIGIRASMPIFAGFANMYAVRDANANYERATELERATSDNATLDIFTAYQNYKTAQKVLTQTQTLLASAKESEKVTSGMYKAGRATMLDWQQAQSELVDALKQHNAAKYDLFTKRAAVALAIGDIRIELSKEEIINEEQEN